MIAFLKSSSVYHLKSKLTFIYILNVLDILFTFGLLKTGLFMEANGLMVPVVESALLSILIKLIIPALLIIYILYKLNELSDVQLPVCHIAINIVGVIYSIITLMHLVYTAYFIYTLF